MKAERRDITPKPPREVVVTMSEEEARRLGLSIQPFNPFGDIPMLILRHDSDLARFGLLLRRVVPDKEGT